MLKNHLKLAWRNLWKSKVISLINLIGLTIGLGFFFLAAGYLWNELQVNGIIKDNDRVLVLRSKWKESGMGLEFTTPAPMAQALYEQYPQLVEDFYHHDAINSIISRGDKYFTETLQPGDSTFLRITGFELLQGNPETALDQPNSLILTVAKAIKYFGKPDVVGQTLNIQSFSGGERDFTITGVLKDLPFNTITNFNKASAEIFLSASSLVFFGRSASFLSWQNYYVISYVKLRPGVDPQRLQEPMAQLLQQNTPPEVYQNLALYSSPVKTDYLQQDNGSARRMMYTMAGVACFILFMAIVNFVNTTMGNSLTRLKEAGLRKVLGSSRRQILIQFLGESVLFVFLATLLALCGYAVARLPFGDMLAKELPDLSFIPAYYFLFPVAVAIIIGGLAGCYPAFVLAIQPSINSLKGKLRTVKEKAGLRRTLLSVQFVTALIVFTTAVVVHQQVSYFFNSDLGYDKTAVVVIKTARDWTESGVQKMQVSRNELARLPEVTAATFSYEVPDGQSGNISNKLYKAAQDSATAITATSLVTDAYYAATYGLNLVAGHFFATNNSVGNTAEMILNETAAKTLGWERPEEAVGERLRLQGSANTYTVRGVVQDFHFNTLHEPIRPLYFVPVTDAQIYRYLSVKVKPGNMASTIAALQNKWEALFPGTPFDYAFMDETLARRYANELQLKAASKMASLIALSIVLLGVIGIVLLAVGRRTKELGIRTVLGAGLSHLVWLFAREFFWIILLGSLVAWPVTWLLLQQWLANYAYQVSIGPLPFLAVTLFITAITGLVIAWLVRIKALNNPVESLRSE